jgi:hypothetical protein
MKTEVSFDDKAQVFRLTITGEGSSERALLHAFNKTNSTPKLLSGGDQDYFFPRIEMEVSL